MPQPWLLAFTHAIRSALTHWWGAPRSVHVCFLRKTKSVLHTLGASGSGEPGGGWGAGMEREGPHHAFG